MPVSEIKEIAPEYNFDVIPFYLIVFQFIGGELNHTHASDVTSG